MNVAPAALKRPLVIGFGNSLRGDDGVGRFVAEVVAADTRFSGADVLAVHQLTPDLAADVAQASRLVLVDASSVAAPGTIAVSEMCTDDRSADAGTAMTHHLDVSALLGLARRLYGEAPSAAVVSVGVGSTELGGRFTPEVVSAVPAVVETVARLCAEAGHA